MISLSLWSIGHILSIKCAQNVMENSYVMAFGQVQVTAILEDGRKFEGDLLVGADGIWSKVM